MNRLRQRLKALGAPYHIIRDEWNQRVLSKRTRAGQNIYIEELVDLDETWVIGDFKRGRRVPLDKLRDAAKEAFV